MGGIGEAFGFGGSSAGQSSALASNEFLDRAISELKRQFNRTQESLQPFITAGQGAVPGLIEGSTAGGLDERLGRVFNTDIFSNLVDERTRAVEGQLGAGGLTRSGTALTEIANVPTNLGLALEDLLTTRLGNLSGRGQNAAAGLGALGAQTSAGIANLFGQQGTNVGSGIITDAQSKAQGTQNLLNAGATAAGIFFSDPALKENVEPIGEIGDLTLHEWDWIPEVRGGIVEKCGTMGFMADEVKEKYPQHIREFGGFLMIDYPSLLEELGT